MIVIVIVLTCSLDRRPFFRILQYFHHCRFPSIRTGMPHVRHVLPSSGLGQASRRKLSLGIHLQSCIFRMQRHSPH